MSNTTNKEKAGQTERCGLLALFIRELLELSHGPAFFEINNPKTFPQKTANKRSL